MRHDPKARSYIKIRAMKVLTSNLWRARGISCALALFIACCLAAVKSSAAQARDLSGVWNTTDSCFPDTPYTMIIAQEGDSFTVTSTLGSMPFCNGTLNGSMLELNCADDRSPEAPYVLTGEVLSETSLEVSRTEAKSVQTCALTKHAGLDPLVEQMLGVINFSEAIKPMGRRTPRQMRRYMARMNSAGLLFSASPVASINNIRIPGPAGSIPVRLYTPEGTGPFPVIVFYHGGGWVVGNAKMFDHYSRLLAGEARALVFSVDYRLAPEHVFPAALDDAYAAVQWVAENAASINGDPMRIAVAGESAGANLAAVVCMLARDQGGPDIVFQVLMCPVTNVSEMHTDSYNEFAEGYFLTREWMEAFRGYYLPDSNDWADQRVSPLLAESLAGLPPALVITAAYDVLRDEGEAYARRLFEAGVPTKQYRCGGVIHGFTTGMIDFLDQSKDAASLTARELEEVF
ncbi:MAG: alpha/beta hydrolase [Deltaproteobacteria bacterium]|nr:alpha/beta hydrolase [Deltaproteobacteria bacterium]